jgi:outer membrane protein assembly factor BamD
MRKIFIFLAVLPLVFVSCGGQKAAKKVDSPGNLYVQGVDFMKQKKYDKAIANFTKVRENYPFDPIALVAQVKQGDAHFEKKEYQMAAGIYEDFINSHPEDENAAYALKRVGECYEKLSPSLDRDQANTYKAVERFTFLKNRYGSSTYARDIDAHLKNLTEKLAARELYVGEFYYRTEKYNAAVMRLEYFLMKFPEAKDRDKALYYLAQSYKELNKPDKSQHYLDRLKQEYPKSVFSAPIKRERKRLQIARPEPPQATGPAAIVPASYVYEERKRKEIDLRPVEPFVVKDAEPGSPAKDRASEAADAKGRNSRHLAASTDASPFAALPTAKTGPTGEADNALSGTAAQTEGRDAEARPAGSGDADKAPAGSGAEAAGTPGTDRKKPDDKQAKKPGDKKDSLGFFTEKKPVDVVADTMEGLEKGKIIVFKGNVIAKQEDLHLFSDMLTAYVNEETNEIERAKAEGNVKIVKLDRTATCKEAYFYNDKGEIILKGDVVVFSGNDKISGDTVTYYINEDRVVAQGETEKRARAVVTPK